MAEKEVLHLLIEMFPKLKQYFIDLYYSPGGLRDLKNIILSIDTYVFLPPTIFNHNEIKFLVYDSYTKRDKKYNLFLESKIEKFFRKSYTDPRELNLLTCTPITIDENNIVLEGKHRAYTSKKFKTPIRAVKVVKEKNIHKNVEKIINLSKDIQW